MWQDGPLFTWWSLCFEESFGVKTHGSRWGCCRGSSFHIPWKLYNQMGLKKQIAIAEFARSLLIIPNTLALNAASSSIDLIAKLRAFWNETQVDPECKSLKWIGLDLVTDKPWENKQTGVYEPTIVKVRVWNLWQKLQILFFELVILSNYTWKAKISMEVIKMLFTQKPLMTDLISLL